MLIKSNFLKFNSFFFYFILIGLIISPWKSFANIIKNDAEIIHIVSPGESINRIAYRYFSYTGIMGIGELIGEIKEINGISGSLIFPNQRLLIPVVESPPTVARTVTKPRDFEARGIYINRYSMGGKKMSRLVNEVINSGGNTVILDAKDMNGRLSYRSKVKLAGEIGSNSAPAVSDFSKMIYQLHEKKLHVVVRQVLFFDPILAERRPDLVLHSLKTGKPLTEKRKIGWVDPNQPVVQKYNLDIAKELARLGVDEIQFDYIRYPTSKNILETSAGPRQSETIRHEVITSFLARAQRELKPFNILLSIDVFGIIGWGRPEDIQMTGQKIVDLAKYCDVISPMIYPSHFTGPFQGIARPADQPFELVLEGYRRFSNLLKDSTVTIRPWIQAFPYRTSNFDKTYILEELRALAQAKSRGWLLWSAGNVYGVSWKALAQWNQKEADIDLNLEQSFL